MALSRVKTWGSEILTAADLNAEFDNILNNTLSSVSPLTGALDANSNDITNLDELEFNDGAANPTTTTRLRLNGSTLLWRIEDSRTNTTTRPFGIMATTTGTPAASIGVGMLFQGESGDEAPSDFGALDFVASDITAASEDTYLSVLLRVAGGTLDEKYRFGSTAGSGFTAIFAHAATADRTYTLPDATTTFVGTDTTDTLSSKTLSAPVLSGTVTGTYTLGGTPTLPLISSTNYPATTSAQLAGVISDETGSGALVFGTSPTFVTPALGTPASGVATNLTGTAAGLTAGNVTTNANLTGIVTSVGNATAIADKAISYTKLDDGTDGNLITWDAAGVVALVATGTANQVLTSNGAGAAPTFQAASVGNLTGPITSVGLATSVAAQTGTGSTFVMQASPTLTTPNIGTPSAGVLTNATGLPLTTGVTGTLGVTNGGTGLATIANAAILVTNSADTLTAVVVGALQTVRRNAGNTAWEVFTPAVG